MGSDFLISQKATQCLAFCPSVTNVRRMWRTAQPTNKSWPGALQCYRRLSNTGLRSPEAGVSVHLEELMQGLSDDATAR